MSRAAAQTLSPAQAADAALPLGAVKVAGGDANLARRILPILLAGKSFVLVTADEPKAPPALGARPADPLTRDPEVIQLRCDEGLDVDAFLAECCRALAVAAGSGRSSMHRAIVAKLLRQQREGLGTVLVLEDAGSLADDVLEQIHRLFRLDDRCLLPAVLVATPDFAERLQSPALDFLREAIAAHFRLEPDGASQSEPDRTAPADASPDGDNLPAVVSRLETASRSLVERTAASALAPQPQPRIAAESAAAAGDSFAALALHASQLLKDLEGRTSERAAETSAQAASESQDLVTLLQGLRSEPAPLLATSAPPAATPALTRAEPIAALPPPVAQSRRWGGAAALAGASLYVIASIVVGGGVVHLWRSGHLSPSAEWISDIRSMIDTQAARLGALRPSAGPVAAAPLPEDDAAEAPAAAMPVEAAVIAAAEETRTPAAVAADEPAAPVRPEPTTIAAADPATVATPAPAPAVDPPAPPVMVAPTPDPVVAAPAPAPSAEPPAPPPAAAVVVAAAPAPVAPRVASAASPKPVAPAMPAAQIEQFRKRGDELLATGDIAAARLFYEGAAGAGDARAALALGKTHDPLFLEQVHARGVPPDQAKAVDWYRAAEARGNAEATKRLETLFARFPEAAAQ
jgi:hypothetical protein